MLDPQTQLGPHRIERPLGRGGMGEVYEARDTRLNRTVALKRVTPEFRDRFELDASPDGKRFVVAPLTDARTIERFRSRLVVLLNFSDEVRRRIP